MLLAVLGTWEIVIVLALIILVFGPSKLPQLGEGIGKMLRGFKKEMKAAEAEGGGAEDTKAPEAIDVTPTGPEGAPGEGPTASSNKA